MPPEELHNLVCVGDFEMLSSPPLIRLVCYSFASTPLTLNEGSGVICGDVIPVRFALSTSVNMCQFREGIYPMHFFFSWGGTLRNQETRNAPPTAAARGRLGKASSF